MKNNTQKLIEAYARWHRLVAMNAPKCVLKSQKEYCEALAEKCLKEFK